MTQVIVLGEIESKKSKKKIEFNYFCGGDMQPENECMKPNGWAYIELICKDYTDEGLDLMYAYDDPKTRTGALYIGKFNDGIV